MSDSEKKEVKKEEEEAFSTEESVKGLTNDFSKAFVDKKYCDVVLKVNDYSFSGHKIVLASRSNFFNKIFQKETGKEIDLSKYIDMNEYFKSQTLEIIFEYFYSGMLRITSKNVLDVYGLCSNMELDSAEKLCNSFIDKMIDSSSVCGLLLAARNRKKDKLIDSCMKAIEDNTEEAMDSEEYLDLPEQLIISLLKNEKLQCTEKSLFEGVLRWWCANKDKLVKGDKKVQDKYLMEKLLYFIRYPLMSSDELFEIEKMKLIPEAYILDAFRHHACSEFDNPYLDEAEESKDEKKDIYKDGTFRTKPRGESVGFIWNSKKLGADMKLIKNVTLWIEKSGVQTYQSALGSKGYDHGVHFWEIDIVSCSYSSHIMVGIALVDMDVTQWVGQDKKGWSWFGYNGTKYHDSKSPSYNNNQKFKQGDIVGVKLDLRKEGILSFYLNGKAMGFAYKALKAEIKKGDKFYPAITLRTTNDKIMLRTKKLKYTNEYKKNLSQTDK